MSSNRDEIDHAAAAQFAWRLPGQEATPAAEPKAELPDEDRRARSIATCNRVEARLPTITSMSPGAARDAAVDAFVSELNGLTYELVNLEPWAGAATLRLLIEGLSRQPPSPEIELLVAVIPVINRSLTDDDVVATFLEGLRAGRSELPLIYRHRIGALSNPATQRLARGLSELLRSPSTADQYLAAWALSDTPLPGATRALREALRLPVFYTRGFVLDALCRIEGGVTAEDTEWLLDDAITHGIGPWGTGHDDRAEYEALVCEALRQAPGARTAEQLQHFATRTHVAYHALPSETFHAAALAATFPERAVGELETLMRSHRAEPESILPPIRHVPEDLARPLLERLADDIQPSMAVAAREEWQERFGAPCPVPRTIGPLAALLDGPPSPAFASRLALLDSDPEAAAALAVALMNEAPSTEALALLLHALGGRRLQRNKAGERLFHPEDWARRWARLFPREKLLRGLLVLTTIERQQWETVSAIRHVVEITRATPAMKVELRELARRGLAADASDYSSIALLALIGPKASDWPALWKAATTRYHDDYWGVPRQAVDTLARIGRCRALDDAIVEGLGAKWKSELTLGDLARLAVLRKVKPAIAMIPALLESYTPDRLRDAFLEIARAAYAAKLIDDAWIRAQLRHPERPLFGIAAWIEAPEKVRGAVPLLRKALGSRERDGWASVEALYPLAATLVLRWNDPVQARVLKAAGDASVLWFLEEIRSRTLGTEGHGKAIVRLLTSADRAIATGANSLIISESDKRRTALYRKALPNVKHDDLREEMRVHLGLSAPKPYARDRYWVDVEGLARSYIPASPPPNRRSIFGDDDWEEEEDQFDDDADSA